jgi:ribose 5-phosphate isomerase B
MSDAERDEVVAIASDHGGFDLKQVLSQELETLGYQVLDLGTHGAESVDYPTYAEAMADALLSGRARRGVLLCGTGIGVSIAANRRPGIRAALCYNVETARLARQHNNANILALGGRTTDATTAKAVLRAFLDTAFEDGGRHERRVAMMG